MLTPRPPRKVKLMSHREYCEDLEKRRSIRDVLKWDKNPQFFTDTDYGEDRLEHLFSKVSSTPS